MYEAFRWFDESEFEVIMDVHGDHILERLQKAIATGKQVYAEAGVADDLDMVFTDVPPPLSPRTATGSAKASPRGADSTSGTDLGSWLAAGLPTFGGSKQQDVEDDDRTDWAVDCTIRA